MDYGIEGFQKRIYGNELAAPIQRFREGLRTIEKKHTQYFRNTPLLNREHKPNQLRFHYATYYTGSVYGFGFFKDSDLKEDIISECLNLFIEVFITKFK